MLGETLSLKDVGEWEAHFFLEDFRADYRTALHVWTQTTENKTPLQILQQIFPHYRMTERPTPWTPADQAHFEAWLTRVKQRRGDG